jgi:hypothetical protein
MKASDMPSFAGFAPPGKIFRNSKKMLKIQPAIAQRG